MIWRWFTDYANKLHICKVVSELKSLRNCSVYLRSCKVCLIRVKKFLTMENYYKNFSLSWTNTTLSFFVYLIFGFIYLSLDYKKFLLMKGLIRVDGYIIFIHFSWCFHYLVYGTIWTEELCRKSSAETPKQTAVPGNSKQKYFGIDQH